MSSGLQPPDLFSHLRLLRMALQLTLARALDAVVNANCLTITEIFSHILAEPGVHSVLEIGHCAATF